ncbi:hypothetical protein [Aquimarina macrocephali]|uniref:hypothetical protein n=1 Tax=Aquimarina macrocephali TaxID=666563 RepID=UPI003F67CF79
MGFESVVTKRLQEIVVWINSVIESSRNIDELPVQEILVETSKLHVSNGGASESLEVKKIKDNVISDISKSIQKFKAPGNTNDDAWESGDFGIGFTSDGYFLNPGVYASGDDHTLFASWSNTEGNYMPPA